MAIVTLRSHPSKIFLFFSSDDELDVLLNGTPDQKKKLIREYLTGESESSSADEFDKEMEANIQTVFLTQIWQLLQSITK